MINDLTEKLSELVILDITNQQNHHGHIVMGINAERLMQSNANPLFCEVKISAYVEQLNELIPTAEREAASVLIQQKQLSIFDLIRGHFLFTAVLKFVSNFIGRFRKVSISYESLYGALLLSFQAYFDHNHPHFEHYKKTIQALS